MAYSLLPADKGGWSITVINLGSHKLWWWQWASGGQIKWQQGGKYVSWTFRTGFGLPGPLAHTGPEHMMWRRAEGLRSSSPELGCFSKPDNSALLMVSQRWWVRAWEAPLVSLSKFVSTSLSRLFLEHCFVSSLAQLHHCAYVIPLTVPLQGLAYTCMYITYYILCNIAVPGTLSWVSCLLVASPTERDQHYNLCIARGRSVVYSLLPAKSRQVKYHCYWLRCVTDFDGDTGKPDTIHICSWRASM